MKTVFLGENLLAWLLLAMGGALVAGNLMALLRPTEPRQRSEGDLERAPLGRSLLMIAVGAVAAIWALASLIGG